MRYDALRILAETYKAMGEYALCKDTIALIPEIYFTKLQLDALLLEGGDMFQAACEQAYLSAETLLEMLLRLADYYEAKEDLQAAQRELSLALKIVEVMKDAPIKAFDGQIFQEYCGKDILDAINKRLNKQ